MNILIIGNGFDLAHGLPTKYDNFLNFCEFVKSIHKHTISNTKILEIYINKSKIDERIYSQLLTIGKTYFDKKSPITSEPSLKAINELITDNKWIYCFTHISPITGKNWVDFETEIKTVIQSLEGKDGTELFETLDSLFGSSSFDRTTTIDKIILKLETDLQKLIRALEIYLLKFVSELHIDKISLFNELQVERVLNFNYTHTHRNHYDRVIMHDYITDKDIKIHYSYIHGQISDSSNLETNNMVLGIDEYLPEERMDKELAFISFKKYFQRIFKGTGNEYLDWVDDIKYDWKSCDAKTQNDIRNSISHHYYKNGNSDLPNSAYQLYVFGHSLDITDGDVLKKLILNDNVKTNIFYYRKNENDKSDLKQKITNLVKIIGQEELIKRTGGPTRTIEFIPQELPKTTD